MLSQSTKLFLAFLALSSTDGVMGRERWLERDNRPVFLYPRRFGQEQPTVLTKLRDACPGQVCGTLAGQAVTPLLAAQPECSQQDLADAIIDASKQFDAATQANMIAIAKEYRQAEKNTPPDFSTNPPTLRNSVFCQKAPKNPELIGLVQAQDPANDPNLFFDPATKATVRKGEQANTFPFGQGQAGSAASPAADASDVATDPTPVLVADASDASGTATACVTEITITVTGTATLDTTNAVTVSVGDDAATATTTAATGAPTATSGESASIGNFGSCTVPQIEFGQGFDGRKETSFQPVDKVSFNHGSAQNIDIITQFICDTLTNSCKADQTAKDTCATAKAAASAATAKTGAQADAFNAAFGIITKFVDVTAIDNQGNPVPGTGAGAGSGQGATASSTTAVSSSPTSVVDSNEAVASSTPSPTTSASGVGNFGKCSVPQIEFATGFDNRKETSFQPVDKASFNHGSAQNIDIITQFICDTLVNSCGADQTARDTCASAKAAASAAAVKTGAQADAFNAVFGITTNFAAVQPIDDQGRPVGSVGNTGSNGNGANTVTTTKSSTSQAAPTATSSQTNNNGSSNSGNLQTFTGALGGVSAPAVTDAGNGQFQVEGNSLFNNKENALTRSCDVQQNQCSNAANASGNKGDLTVGNCGAQGDQCRAAV